jgi:hypothetical protein
MKPLKRRSTIILHGSISQKTTLNICLLVFVVLKSFNWFKVERDERMQSAEIITTFSLREESRRKMVHTPIFRCQFFKFSFYKNVIASNTFHLEGKYWTRDIPSAADRKMTSLRRSRLMYRPCQSFVLDEENNDVETAIGYDSHLKQRMPLYIEANRRIVTKRRSASSRHV